MFSRGMVVTQQCWEIRTNRMELLLYMLLYEAATQRPPEHCWRGGLPLLTLIQYVPVQSYSTAFAHRLLFAIVVTVGTVHDSVTGV